MKKTSRTRAIALRHGFRSGLEDKVAGELTSKGVGFSYEDYVVSYLVPARKARYTPDFILLDNGIIVETKGRFETKDRQKHILIKNQHPELDIRFVFSNPNQRISKQSKTTYAMWCMKYNFKYDKGSIPQAWINEPRKESRFTAMEKAKHAKKN